ncbi:hypothetical protein [Aquamicrobium terrae]|uniref:Uncharacterized protein n=1 Tax=Aquamicrobium terrae TaxID=1324945 RepID=A0ABV2N6T6_9HYPH
MMLDLTVAVGASAFRVDQHQGDNDGAPRNQNQGLGLKTPLHWDWH